MKATLLNFVLVSLVAASLGVRSRARELRAGADVKPDGPSAPGGNDPRRLRKNLRRDRARCQRLRVTGPAGKERPKLEKFCARRCAACDLIANDGLSEQCEEDFCFNDVTINPRETEFDTVERGCSRDRMSRKMSRFCGATCRWCAEARRCNDHPKKEDEQGEGSEACDARQCQAKCRCRFANCPNDGEDGLPDASCGNQNFENCDARNRRPLQLPETAALNRESLEEEEFFAMAMELGLPGDEEVFDDEESFARAMELGPPGTGSMSMSL